MAERGTQVVVIGGGLAGLAAAAYVTAGDVAGVEAMLAARER